MSQLLGLFSSFLVSHIIGLSFDNGGCSKINFFFFYVFTFVYTNDVRINYTINDAVFFIKLIPTFFVQIKLIEI